MWEAGLNSSISFLLFGILPYEPFHENGHKPWIFFVFHRPYYKLPANLAYPSRTDWPPLVFVRTSLGRIATISGQKPCARLVKV